MAKATIKLPNGTSVVIDGTTEEITELLAFYGGAASGTSPSSGVSKEESKHKIIATRSEATPSKKAKSSDSPDLPAIIEHIKNCDRAESIEANVLDKAGQVNRILLPLFIVHEYMGNVNRLTSGEVSRITRDLGIPVQQPNASRILSRTASKYVIGDKVRKKGQTVHYELNRRGVQYFQRVLDGKSDDK